MTEYKFAATFCSQCGREFGPGDHGFSHCSTHQVLAKVKADPDWAAAEIERLRFALGQTSSEQEDSIDELRCAREALGS